MRGLDEWANASSITAGSIGRNRGIPKPTRLNRAFVVGIATCWIHVEFLSVIPNPDWSAI
jgi:hypothetical protein